MTQSRKPLYQLLSRLISARRNCIQHGNNDWYVNHSAAIGELINFLPSGSGIDSGCTINLDKSTGEKIVIETSYHHMNDGGMYDGWTDHTVTVRPSFDGIDIIISGRNRNDIKDYLFDVFYESLNQIIVSEWNPITNSIDYTAEYWESSTMMKWNFDPIALGM